MAIPPVVLTLLLSNSALFFIQNPAFTYEFALWPFGGPYAVSNGRELFQYRFEVWQLLSYAFLHGSLLHLLSNMLALFMFGIHLERLWGSVFFLKFYFVSVVTAAVTQLVITQLGTQFGFGTPAPMVGASGGVFGILLAFGLLFPNQKIMLLIPPIPIKARLFVILYGVFELYAGLTGTLADIAHFAHLGGMIGGFLMLQQWKKSQQRPD